jgi:hypothetical protein
MAFMRGIGRAQSSTPLQRSAAVTHEEQRRSLASSLDRPATLACRACDAPVAIGPDPLSLRDELTCPFCATRGAVRDFLSLDPPTRPARVIVRAVVRDHSSDPGR